MVERIKNRTLHDLIILFLIALVLMSLVFIQMRRNTINIEEGPHMNVSLEKYLYAMHLRFDMSVVIDGERVVSHVYVQSSTTPGFDMFNPQINDFVFVHSEAEAANFSDNVIVAWPRMGDVYFSLGLVYMINWTLDPANESHYNHLGTQMREIINLEDFGLSCPLTVIDLVDNWEKVNELWRHIHPGEQSTIMRLAAIGGSRIHEGYQANCPE